MRLRFLAAFAAVSALLVIQAPWAQATGTPPTLQRLAAAQSQLVFKFYDGPPQTASPPTCRAGRNADTVGGVLLLPTLSFGTGDETFWCRTQDRAALVDMGGYIVTEDARSDDTYQLQSGEVVLFTRANLARICADALRLTPVPAPATLDGRALSGRPVSTPTFNVKVNPGTADQPNTPYYQDSIDVGHPGRLTACYSGQKALVHLKPGRHVLRVDLTGEGLPTRFTYYIDVDSNHR